MPTVFLVVTQRVADLVEQGQIAQRQIAIRRPAAEMRAVIAEATSANTVGLRLGNAITLVVGDNGAIWRAHQPNPDDFDSLFDLLSRRPGQEMEFVCDISYQP